MTSPTWGPPQGQPTFPGRGFGNGGPSFGNNGFGGNGYGQPQFGRPQMAPSGMQQYGMPGGFPQPPRRRSPLGGCLRALLVVGALVFIGGAAALHFLGGVVTQAGGTATSSPTDYSTAYPSDSSTSGGSDPGTTEPTTQDTASASTSATIPSGAGASASASVPAGSYQNDSYTVPSVDTNPPALPEPDTYSEATTWLQSNKLYSQSVAKPVRCEMKDIDLATASRTQLQAHLNELTGCLMRVWAPTLQAAGYVAVRPSVTIYSGSVTTQCGKLPSQNAVYCGADQQIYYAADLPDLIPTSLANSKFITESIIAHEFGHAVQARSGILISESAWQEKQDTKSAQYNYSRRLELQADCFAGEFLSSVAQSTGMSDTDLTNIQKLFYSFGDDILTGNPDIVGNHGHGVDRQGWMKAGMGNAKLSTCNTFTASSSSTR